MISTEARIADFSGQRQPIGSAICENLIASRTRTVCRKNSLPEGFGLKRPRSGVPFEKDSPTVPLSGTMSNVPCVTVFSVQMTHFITFQTVSKGKPD